MLIKRFLGCQGHSLARDAWWMRTGSVPEGWEKLPQEEAGEEQEGQRNSDEQNHLEESLSAAERVGGNQIAHRLFPCRLLVPTLAPLSSRICQGFLPNEA